MRQIKRSIRRLLLPLLIIAAIVVMSAITTNRILKVEEEKCWDILENEASTINRGIATRFQDNIAMLKMASGAMVQEERVESYDAIAQHLNSIRQLTIFDRIDMLYPNGQILYQNEGLQENGKGLSFEALSAAGEHMSLRTTDSLTGKECIYYAVPVVAQEHTVAIMVGMIYCENMPAIFPVSAYNGQAMCTLVDYRDGSFILDEWHEQLGNIHQMKQRKMLKGYENVDVIDDVSNGRTGVVRFVSEVNGEQSFMYYAPNAAFHWELMIVAQDAVVFESVFKLENTLHLLELCVGCMILMYFIWTMITVRQLEKSKEEISEKKKKYEELSYTDTMTNLFNRNKYNEVIDVYETQPPRRLGTAILDLNGLKQINDSQGHRAGDTLIQNTGKCLHEVFPGFAYRIGGDEFVVLVPDLDEADFKSRVEQLQGLMQERNINISMGSTWVDVVKDFKTQLQAADERMYVQKNTYYESLGE